MHNKTVTIASAQYQIDQVKTFDDWKNKIQIWVEKAVDSGAQILIFPENGLIEITSIFSNDDQFDLKILAVKLSVYIDEIKLHFSNLAQKYKVYIIAPSLPFYQNDLGTTNRVYVFSRTGQIEHQDKLTMTRFEEEIWGLRSGEKIVKIFDTELCMFSVITCFDIEFSLPSLAASHGGAQIIFVPSSTETIKGANRVHISARARAIENQNFVVVSQLVGEAEWSLVSQTNYGYSGFYATPDVGFPNDGIIQTGAPNVSQWVIQQLRLSHIDRVRSSGAVFNFKKHKEMQKTFPIQTKMIKLD